MDGRICLDFHNMRNKNPELFKSKVVNYGWYAGIALKNSLYSKTLHKILRIKVKILFIIDYYYLLLFLFLLLLLLLLLIIYIFMLFLFLLLTFIFIFNIYINIKKLGGRKAIKYKTVRDNNHF